MGPSRERVLRLAEDGFPRILNDQSNKMEFGAFESASCTNCPTCDDAERVEGVTYSGGSTKRDGHKALDESDVETPPRLASFVFGADCHRLNQQREKNSISVAKDDLCETNYSGCHASCAHDIYSNKPGQGIALRGMLLIVKAFVGQHVELPPTGCLNSNGAGTTAHSGFDSSKGEMTRILDFARHNVCAFRQMAGSSSKSKEWFFFDHTALLPEYILSFEYILEGSESFSEPTTLRSDAGKLGPIGGKEKFTDQVQYT